jgi:hypothetical protein
LGDAAAHNIQDASFDRGAHDQQIGRNFGCNLYHDFLHIPDSQQLRDLHAGSFERRDVGRHLALQAGVETLHLLVPILRGHVVGQTVRVDAFVGIDTEDVHML